MPRYCRTSRAQAGMPEIRPPSTCTGSDIAPDAGGAAKRVNGRNAANNFKHAFMLCPRLQVGPDEQITPLWFRVTKAQILILNVRFGSSYSSPISRMSALRQ